MSVLIKGMEMPKGCLECPFKDVGMNTMTQCMLVAGWVKYENDGYGIPSACPLVDVPTPHGRLIDADKLKSDNPRHMGVDVPYVTEVTVEEIIDEATTIIEAEE